MDSAIIATLQAGNVTPKIVYSSVQLRSIRGALTVSIESPVETAAYSVLLKGRSTETSAKKRDQQQSQVKNFHGDSLANSKPTFVPETISNISADNNGKWRQQRPIPLVQNRPARNLQDSQSSIHDKITANSPIRGNYSPQSTQVDNRDTTKIRSPAPQPRNMSSAEQQRQQFEKERLEIEMNRQNAKKLSSGTSDSKGSSSTPGRNPLYHDECDLLMDELAGKSTGAIAISVALPTPLSMHPPGLTVQSMGKSNMLLGAMGITEDKRGQASQQPMKKISLDHIFAKSAQAAHTPAPPGIRLVATNALNNGMSSAGAPFSYDRNPSPPSKHDGGINYDEIGSYLIGSGGADADDDYEESMRMIDRMIGGDDDYDYFKEDKLPRVDDVTNGSQQTSRYTFPASSALTTELISKPLVSSIYKAPQQSAGVYAPLHTSGVSLNVNTLFAAARLHGENSGGIVQMSNPSEMPSARDRSGSTDVLFKLGFGTQGQHQKEERRGVMNTFSQQGQPVTPQTPLRLSGSSSDSIGSPSGVANQRGVANMNMSPFAFHSSSSGGGSSGGGARRSAGNTNAQVSALVASPVHTNGDTKSPKLLGKSSISASSRQQLMKMVRGSTPSKTSSGPSSNGMPTAPAVNAPQNKHKQQQQQQHQLQQSSTPDVKAITPVRLAPPTTPKEKGKEKEIGLQRISLSDLFKSSLSSGPAPTPGSISTPPPALGSGRVSGPTLVLAKMTGALSAP